MVRRVLVVLSTIIVAAGILVTSLFRSATVRYSFNLPSFSDTSGPQVLGEQSSQEKIVIDYEFTYPGKVLPDHPLWSLKALRDKLWLLVSTSPEKKAELKLLFADKRLLSSRTLFEKEKPEIAYSVLSKGEKYLEEVYPLIVEAQKRGVDMSALLIRLSLSSLKHREVIDEILKIAPEDARPQIAKTQDYSKEAFKSARDALQEMGLDVSKNPFDID